MPALAPWRQYRENLARKGGFDAQLVFESEVMVNTLSKENDFISSSPVSIASSLLPEMQPLNLPGAWTVVGKGGRPLKNEPKMYDEPVKKKKKKKARRLVDSELEPTVEEEPSTSKCLEMIERSETQRMKAITRSHDKKYWVRYQQAKQLKREAVEALIAVLESESTDGDDASDRAANGKKLRHMTLQKEKIRRTARREAAAARCEWPGEDEFDGDAPTRRSHLAHGREQRISQQHSARVYGQAPFKSDKRKASDTIATQEAQYSPTSAKKKKEAKLESKRAEKKSCVTM